MLVKNNLIKNYIKSVLIEQVSKKDKIIKTIFDLAWINKPIMIKNSKLTDDIIYEKMKSAFGKYNAKTLEWVIRYLKSDDGKNEAISLKEFLEFLDQFNEHKKKLKDKNLFSYKTLADIRSAIEESIVVDGENKRVPVQDKIYEDENFVVIFPHNVEASRKYGKGTKWCISGESGNYFDQYTLENKAFIYFIINKNSDTFKDKFAKIAVGLVDCEIGFDDSYVTDATDQAIYEEELIEDKIGKNNWNKIKGAILSDCSKRGEIHPNINYLEDEFKAFEFIALNYDELENEEFKNINTGRLFNLAKSYLHKEFTESGLEITDMSFDYTSSDDNEYASNWYIFNVKVTYKYNDDSLYNYYDNSINVELELFIDTFKQYLEIPEAYKKSNSWDAAFPTAESHAGYSDSAVEYNFQYIFLNDFEELINSSMVEVLKEIIDEDDYDGIYHQIKFSLLARYYEELYGLNFLNIDISDDHFHLNKEEQTIQITYSFDLDYTYNTVEEVRYIPARQLKRNIEDATELLDPSSLPSENVKEIIEDYFNDRAYESYLL